MAVKLLVAALAAAHAVSAHFKLSYPEWRADSLAQTPAAKYSEWTYPCAGVDYGAGNTTDWPLDGGSLKLNLHHPWTYIFVNLGLGRNATNFNLSLTPEFWNASGKGDFCVTKLPLPVKVDDGALASLQVVTVGESGAALYSCADIRFKRDARTLDNCSAGDVKYAPVVEQKASANASATTTDKPACPTSQKTAGVAALGANTAALAAVAGLAALFALGVGF